MPDSRSFDRRRFLGTVAALGAGTVLAACGGGDAPSEPAATPDTGGTATTPAPAPAGDQLAATECAGYDALTEQDLTLRETLGYVDVSPVEGEYCNNCQFQQAYEPDDRCLGCTLFPGPVTPEGYCNSWFEQGAS